MAKISSQEAIKAVGGDQFLLVLVAAQRARELARGDTPRIDSEGNSNTVIALREIEQGKYTKEEYYQKISEKEIKNEHHTKKSQRRTSFDFGSDSFY